MASEIEQLARNVEKLAGVVARLANVVKENMSAPEYAREEVTEIGAKADAIQDTVGDQSGANESGSDNEAPVSQGS